MEEIPLFKPRYNIAPTHQAPVTANLGGANRVELFQWELVGEIDARSNLATSILMRNSDWLDKGTMNFPTEPGVKLL
ncbi:MAG: hypothetical protein ACXW50_17510 [Candidatus Binatia bacterium]